MQYPSKLDYDNAVWNLSKTVRCSEFSGGNPRNDGLDLEHYTGGFSRVYLIDLNNRTVVLRVWLNEIPNVRSLYTQADKLLSEKPNPYFVNFRYIKQGIEVNQHVWPVLYMDWVNGLTLNKFLDTCLPNSPKKVENTAEQFLNLVGSLHQSRISHGDLQDGNLLVTNTTEPLGLKLIDYDTLHISGFKGVTRKTVGVSGYQHPKRAGQVVRNLKWDYFSELVIYLSLRAYTEKPQIWIPNKEKALLFSKSDFDNPVTSPVFKTLNSMSEEVRRLSEQLAAYCNETDLNQLLPLEKVILNIQRAELLGGLVGQGVSHKTSEAVVNKHPVEEHDQRNIIETKNSKKPESTAPQDTNSESRNGVNPVQKTNETIPVVQQQTTQSAPQSSSSGCFWVIVFIILILFLLFGILNGKRQNVSSTSDWQDSGMQVNSGDTILVIPLSGVWSADYNNPQFPLVDAIGYNGGVDGRPTWNYSDWCPDKTSFLASWPLGILTGGVSNSSDIFRSGGITVFHVPDQGNLYFRMNDCSFDDNYGEITIWMTKYPNLFVSK
jgi:serine/threonine protein kinase